MEITVRGMASVKECEKLRGEAEVKLLKEIQKLKTACEVEAPNKRLVANLVASLDIAQDLVMEMNAQPNEARYNQYLDGLLDAAEEVKAVAEVITGAVDGDGVPNPQLDSGSLQEDYAMMAWKIET